MRSYNKTLGLGSSNGLPVLLFQPVAEDGASASACSLSPVAADFFSWPVAAA